LAPALQFGDDAVERRQPVANQVVVIARAEKPCDSTEQAGGLISPRYAAAILEGRLDFFLVAEL
jgi:hypothetical protein